MSHSAETRAKISAALKGKPSPLKGVPRTEETRKKIGAALKGRPLSEETRRKLSEANLGKTHSAETRMKISAAGRGRPVSTETRAKMSAVKMGHAVSDDARRKIGEASRGRAVSEETRRKLSESGKGKQKGKVLSEDHRAKISESLTGKTQSEETRRKRIASLKKTLSTEEARCKLRDREVSEETRRKLSEQLKGKYCGPAASQWRGGLSFEPYCIKFNESFKERVREFFGRVCTECGKTEIDNGQRLQVHHVNFRKDSCCAEDVVPLFVPLCRSCHSRTNYNREYWEARFTALISEQYGGQCYLPKQDAVIGQEVSA